MLSDRFHDNIIDVSFIHYYDSLLSLSVLIIDLVKYIIDRSGMRSLITLLIDGSLLYLLMISKLTETYAIGGIIIVTITYFVFRHFEKGRKEINVSNKI